MSNIHIRLSDEKKKVIVDAAKAEGLTVTAFIINAINEHIAQSRR